MVSLIVPTEFDICKYCAHFQYQLKVSNSCCTASVYILRWGAAPTTFSPSSLQNVLHISSILFAPGATSLPYWQHDEWHLFFPSSVQDKSASDLSSSSLSVMKMSSLYQSLQKCTNPKQQYYSSVSILFPPGAFLSYSNSETSCNFAFFYLDEQGEIATCAGVHLHLWSINGDRLATVNTSTGRDQQILCCTMSEVRLKKHFTSENSGSRNGGMVQRGCDK